jgi:LmbE family N-acetylglucosaminyl deacetylase
MKMRTLKCATGLFCLNVSKSQREYVMPCLVYLLFFFPVFVHAQTPVSLSASEIYIELQKLKVTASVLYIAAHPDDENTRLLTYLSKERKYRTAYLSLTRGDGGQNLIGEEQGIELGMIRTQELLAARRKDGAEQYFTRAFDFGYSKTTDETLRIWKKDRVLADMVWIIRTFRPDVIITRFPPDSRAGHGHHSASAVLAQEAFNAAADSTRFPEQFQRGVRPWQAKRILWNTYNFSSAQTIRENQLKIDVGLYNPMLGKSYGEIASESRSQHKRQGFGVPRQRGQQYEYFEFVAGDTLYKDIADGVPGDWSRVQGGDTIEAFIGRILNTFSLSSPSQSVPLLIQLHQMIEALPESHLRSRKLKEVQLLIESCSGLWMEAFSDREYVTKGDSLRLQVAMINRTGVPITVERVYLDTTTNSFLTGGVAKIQSSLIPSNETIDTLIQSQLLQNTLFQFPITIHEVNRDVTNPYWLSFYNETDEVVQDNSVFSGAAENDPVYRMVFRVTILGRSFEFRKPVLYKYNDPVKGELYQPLVVYPPVAVRPDQSLLVFNKQQTKQLRLHLNLHSQRSVNLKGSWMSHNEWRLTPDLPSIQMEQGVEKDWVVSVQKLPGNLTQTISVKPRLHSLSETIAPLNVRRIAYDHIPAITYFPEAQVKTVYVSVKTAGTKIGYLPGAGDQIPTCLRQIGYEVTLLDEHQITFEKLRTFDAIVTGIRAYNIHDWLKGAFEPLMQYVNNGGVLLVQYNTSNQIGPLKARIAPFPFTISRNRVTNEQSNVKLIDPRNPIWHYPNTITADDFNGWVQERTVYEADSFDAAYTPLLEMHDPGEKERNGSLLMVSWGKGRVIYCALSLFRQLPAGVPGAYRIMANLLAHPKH